MKDRLDMKGNENFSVVEQMTNQLAVEKKNVEEKENEILKLKQQHKVELAALEEEMNNISSRLQVKDAYIVELEERNDDF
jgi:hypothetical protein